MGGSDFYFMSGDRGPSVGTLGLALVGTVRSLSRDILANGSARELEQLRSIARDLVHIMVDAARVARGVA